MQPSIEVTEAEQTHVQKKIENVRQNIDKVLRVNGDYVFNAIVVEDKICYWQKPVPFWFKVTEQTERKFYYPIRYAKIEFKS